MKLIQPEPKKSCRTGSRAFTLTEIMVAMAIFAFIVAALCAVQLFAMRVYTLGSTKLSATTGARQSLNDLRELIRSSKVVYVGTYSNGGGFTRIPTGSLQKGNALEFATTNTATTNYLVYYLDNWDPTNTLYCISNNLTGTLQEQARYVTNYYCFYGENYQGSNTTDYENNTVIHVVLQFYRWEYPLGFVGTNAINAYDFYTIQTRVMRRAID
jgi:prepilin-type N-terminal cleavage/methylation domain-containing protein